MRAADVGEIIGAYGAVLAETAAFGLIRDINTLPYLKTDIKEALKLALSVTADATMREQLKVAYISLADFQWLTEGETHALQLWNSALSKHATATGDLELDELGEVVSAEADVVIAVQQRVADESHSLAQELKAAGF
jgi:hypothetical protein